MQSGHPDQTAGPPKVWLHVGSPKTGTTFLQQVLWANTSLAREQGFLLPGERFADHFAATLDIRGIARNQPHAAEASGVWEQLTDQAAAWHGSSLISHELFSAAHPDQAALAVDALRERADVHIVVTARDLLRQTLAEWQEHVKHRSSMTLEQFVSKIRSDESRTSWFWRVQDYSAILDRWGQGLPRENLHVVTVPPPGAGSGVLWERFVALLGLDASGFDTGVARSNSSLGLEQAELLRRVNTALGDRLPIPGPYAGTVKDLLAHRILAAREGTRLALPAEDAEFAAAESRAVADRLAAADVDVVGSLEDLVPDAAAIAAATDETAYAVPPAEAVLEEGVAAIADLLAELSHRRQVHRRAEERLQASKDRPLRYALLQASEKNAVLGRLRTAYGAARGSRKA